MLVALLDRAGLRSGADSVRVADADPVYDALARFGNLVAVAAASFIAVAHVVNERVLGGDVWSLDADLDGNAISWISSEATFVAALAAFALGLLVAERRRILLVLAALLAYFSLDDMVAVHERIGTMAREGLGLETGWGRSIWPVLFLPLLATAFLGLWRTASTQPAPAGEQIRRGLALLVLAVGLEVGSTAIHVTGNGTGWLDALEVALEEGLELAGWILISAGMIAAVYRALRARPAGP